MLLCAEQAAISFLVFSRRPLGSYKKPTSRKCVFDYYFALSLLWGSCFRYSGTGRPPTPQFSNSTSSITTMVALCGLPRTSKSRSLTPLMSAAFCSGVVLDAPGAVPSRVTLMFTYGMVVFPRDGAGDRAVCV